MSHNFLTLIIVTNVDIKAHYFNLQLHPFKPILDAMLQPNRVRYFHRIQLALHQFLSEQSRVEPNNYLSFAVCLSAVSAHICCMSQYSFSSHLLYVSVQFQLTFAVCLSTVSAHICCMSQYSFSSHYK